MAGDGGIMQTARLQAAGQIKKKVESARLESRGERGAWFYGGLGATVVGVAGIWITSVLSAVRWRVGAVVITAIGLMLLHPRMRRWAEEKPTLFLVLGLLSAVAGGLLMWVALEKESPLLACVAVFLAIGAVLVLRARVPASGWRASSRWLYAGPILFLVGPLLMATVKLPIHLGALATVLGLAGYTSSVRELCRSDAASRWGARAGLSVAAAGAFLLFLASQRSSVSIAVAGIYLVVLGLIPLSLGWKNLRLGGLPALAVSVVGALALLVGTFLIVDRLPPNRWPGITLALIVALIGSAFVIRGEALILVVAAGVALVWLSVDRTVEESSDPKPGAERRILALGDSYISGEGSPRFFEGTNVRDDRKNECRRSPTAYPYLLAKELDMGLDFYACSGAKTIEIHKEGQQPKSRPEVVGAKAQLDNIEDDDKAKIKIVLVSIGGNDSLFGDIGKGCTLPGSCEERREVWLGNLDQIGQRITDTYEAIKAELPNVPVLAVPYPLMLNAEGCSGSLLLRREHEFISEFLTVLNDRVRASAANAGVNFFAPGMFSFAGTGICDSPRESSINVLNANPVGGNLVERISPRNWIHGSLHPTTHGHRLMATRLKEEVTRLLAKPPSEANPPPKQTEFRLQNVGTATPALSDPIKLQEPPGLDCNVAGQETLPFASRVLIFDETAPLALNAKPGSKVCYTAGDGSWRSATPSPQGDLTERNGVVRLTPQMPTAERGIQRIVYQATDDTWRVRIVEFCKKQPDCPADTGKWINHQLADALEEMALPGILAFVGGWLFMIGVSVWWRSFSDLQWSEAEGEAQPQPLGTPSPIGGG